MLDELALKVADWGKEKGINDSKAQLLKCHEELDEVWKAIYDKEPTEKVKMEVGDVFVTAIILSDILGFNAGECLDMAYRKIKVRKGKMVDGTYVKEEDFRN